MTININTQDRIPLEKAVGVYGGNYSFKDFTINIFSEPFRDFCNEISNGNFNTMMNSIPYVHIKSYYQKTLIQGLLNLLTSLVDGIQAGMNGIATADEGTVNAMKEKLKDLAAKLTTADTWKSVFAQLASVGDYGSDIAIEKLPSMLMLQLASTIASSEFTLPFFSQEIMNSDGNYGWGAQEMIFEGGMSQGPMGLLKTLGAFTTPIFNPNSGGGEKQNLTLEFDLFNDTAAKAEANTEFVKAIIVHNMWMQYGIFQTPGALYDIKIGKGNNYFNAMYMCTGKFSVKKKGVMRDMDGWFVPDVYSLNLTFSSLLPSNVNSYLFGKLNIPAGRTGKLEDFLKVAKGVFT